MDASATPARARASLAAAFRFDALFPCVAALLGGTVFLFVPAAVMADGDTYSHVATGEWILRQGAVPTTDPFSFTFAGQPWAAHEWLAELLMALAYRAGAWTGVLALCGGAYGLALGNLARHLTRWLPPIPALLAFVLAATCTRTGMLARPHILALPVLELWTASLLIARERNTVPWRSLPLMLAWANLHGGFMFGLALACPFAAEAAWEAKADWHRVAGRWGSFLLAAVALAACNPQGWHGLLFPFQLLQLKQLGNIGEWRPPDFQVLQPIELGIVTALYVCLTRGVRVPPLRVAILIGLVHLALGHDRHQMLAGVVGALVLAGPAGGGIRRPAAAWHPALLPGTLVAFAMLVGARAVQPFTLRNTPTAPVAAFDDVPPDLAAQPVLNDYAFGGYLILKGVRPFIDARADMYGDAFLAEYRDMMRPDRARLIRTLDERNIQWVILATDSRAVPVLDAEPGWHRRFGDAVAVVFTRTP